MILEMYVKDFVLIDEIRISFDEAMSAFTGETGAGKSLLMDAIGILKGDRIQTSLIREGSEKAIIEGVFRVREKSRCYQLLLEAGYDLEDTTFIASREFTRAGKSVARINQRMVNVGFLKEVVSGVVDIHSQHDTQYLLNQRYHLQLLDAFADCAQQKKETAAAFKEYRMLADELESALHNDYNEDDLELLTYQLNEIDQAQLSENELEQIDEEVKRMQAHEKITSRVHSALSLLEDEQHGTASIYEAYRELDSLSEDRFFQDQAQRLLDLYYNLDECIGDIREHYETLSFDEERFHELQERSFLIHKILRKYGGSFQAVMRKREDLEQKIDRILHRNDFLKKHEVLCEKAHRQYMQKAKTLHDIRVAKAKDLEAQILAQLHDLQLENAKFHVQIDEFEGNRDGIDRIAFYISMNPGEALKPLSQTASGGELSRFMLGLKTVFSELQGIETIVFDEIDTGVSGAVAFAVGKKMQELGKHIQVFCVTHLASVAACANHHYMVEKHQAAASTSTTIRLLSEQERFEALALISNNSLSSSALEAAKELYNAAQQNR